MHELRTSITTVSNLKPQKILLSVLIIPLCFTLLVGWFSWSAFLAAPHVAAENLRGAGLSMAAAIEQLAAIDIGLHALARYTTADVAFFSLVDRRGVVRFHTNTALIGTVTAEIVSAGDGDTPFSEQRKRLGTGEEIYQLQSRVHPAGNDLLLTLALHTYRADQVIRRSRTGLTVVALLTCSLWLVTVGLLVLLRRDVRLQHEIRRQEELARLGELGAVMAHEIRNPLSGIKGFAQLMETATSIEQARLYADRIVSQSLRMEALVNDLLAYARADRAERHPADLAALLQDCVTLIRMEAVSAHLEVCYMPQPELKMSAAPDRIIQLLLNLMKNALQAMPEGGTLTVGLEQLKGSAIITIRDTGVGIPPEHLLHIFEPFWTSKAKGTGLGLALCRKVAEEHGGSLAVASTVGSGTTFTQKLPLEKGTCQLLS